MVDDTPILSAADYPGEPLYPSWEFNTTGTGVAEYGDFGPIERCISETVQDVSLEVLRNRDLQSDIYLLTYF